MTAVRRRPGLLAVALAVILALSACATVRSVARVTQLLQEKGYDDVALEMTSANGVRQVQVSYAGAGDGDDGEQRRATAAAELIWRELEVYFDELVFFVSGTSYDDGRLGYSRAGLTGLFGPRPPGLDERDVGAALSSAARTTTRVAAVTAVVLLVAILVVVLLVRRRRGRRALAVGLDLDFAPAPAFDPADPWAPPPGP